MGLGSNLGERLHNLNQAMVLLVTRQVKITAVSQVYETEPVGYLDQPRFLNAVCRAETSLAPQELLAQTQSVEGDIGRAPSFPNAPRLIDIDILFYGEEVVNTPRLVIPHTRLRERAFVLVPLADIAAELQHPILGKRIRDLLEMVRGREEVKPWPEPLVLPKP